MKKAQEEVPSSKENYSPAVGDAVVVVVCLPSSLECLYLYEFKFWFIYFIEYFDFYLYLFLLFLHIFM